MKSFLVFLFLIVCASSTVSNPAIDIAISTDIVQQYKVKALQIVRQKFSSITFPNFDQQVCKGWWIFKACVHVYLDNIRAAAVFGDDDVQVSFSNNQINFNVKATINAYANAHGTVTLIPFSGSVTAFVIGQLSLSVTPTLDANNKLQVALNCNSFDLPTFNINISGGVVADVISWIESIINNQIRSTIISKANDELKAGGDIQNQINSYLLSASSDLTVYENYAVDYVLTRAPIIKSDRIEAQIYSYVFDNRQKEVPPISLPRPFPKDLGQDTLTNKIELLASDYLLNSFTYVLQKDQLLQVNLVDLISNYTMVVENDIENYIQNLKISVPVLCQKIDYFVDNIYYKLQNELKLIHINLPNLQDAEIVQVCEKVGGFINDTAVEIADLTEELAKKVQLFIQNAISKIEIFLDHSNTIIKQLAEEGVQKLETLATNTVQKIDQIAKLLHIDSTGFDKFVEEAKKDAQIVWNNITQEEQKIIDDIKNFKLNFSLYGRSTSQPLVQFENNNLTALVNVGLDMHILGQEVQINADLEAQLLPSINANSTLKLQLFDVQINKLYDVFDQKEIDFNILAYLINKVLKLAVQPLNRLLYNKVSVPLPSQVLGFDIQQPSIFVGSGVLDIAGVVLPTQQSVFSAIKKFNSIMLLENNQGKENIRFLE